MKSRLLGILSLLVLVLALTACDGSSGSSSSSSSGAKGAVAAAPMKLAKVYGLSTDGEKVLIGTTDNSGAFAINSNAAKLQFPAVVWSVGGWNVNDAEIPSKEFKGTLKGVMASADSAVYLTPANSLVAAFFEKSGNLSEAQQQVENLLKYEMGLKMTDPLGNPLTDLNESEIVAKSLMHLIGAGDENNQNAMEKLSAKFTTIANEMSTGKTFTEVLKTMPESPFSSYSAGTLCNCVESEKDTIIAEAKASLGDLGDVTELEKDFDITNTSSFPIALEFDGLSSTENASGTQGAVVNAEFYAVVTTADGNPKPNQTLLVSYLVNGTLSGAEEMNAGEVYTDVPAAQKLIFKVTIPDDATFPYTASFTLETVESDDTLPTFSRTYTVTFFGEDEFAVKEVAYDGDDLFAFATPSTADGEIAEGATSPIAADTFAADVELVNSIDSALADGNMDVRFIAPAGLAFTDLSENADIVTVKSFTQSDKTYTAELPAGSNFIAKDNIEAGFKTVRIQVLDQDGETIARTTKDIVFVPEDQKDNLTGVNLTAQTLKPAVPADGKYAPASINLAGSYRTWVKEANPEATTGGITEAELPAGSKVILMSKSGDKVFGDAASPVDRIEIPVTLTEDFKFTSTVTNFVYNYSIANDDIKMVFMLDSSDSNNNIESPTLLKLRFAPVAP